MARAASGNAAANRPGTKHDAATCSRRSVARTAGTPSALAPASKVSAATLRVVGRRVTTRPSSSRGRPWAVVDVDEVLGGADVLDVVVVVVAVVDGGVDITL